jgi:hypothetical protein
MGNRGLFPGAKAWPRCDADHTDPSSAEVENEYELYPLSLQAPSWRVVGQLITKIQGKVTRDGKQINPLKMWRGVKYLTVRNQIYIYDDIISRLSSNSAYFNST